MEEFGNVWSGLWGMQTAVSEAYGRFQQAPLGTREAKLMMAQMRRKPLRGPRLEFIHSPVGQ